MGGGGGKILGIYLTSMCYTETVMCYVTLNSAHPFPNILLGPIQVQMGVEGEVVALLLVAYDWLQL